jgi:hypothetical protein
LLPKIFLGNMPQLLSACHHSARIEGHSSTLLLGRCITYEFRTI